MKKIWNWIRNIDLGYFVNIALLIAIIAVFSLLIIDITGCLRRSGYLPVEVMKKSVPEQITVTDDSAKLTDFVTLPRPTPKKVVIHADDPKISRGPIIVDGELMNEKLETNTKINGNLVLQNMHRYTLPCGTHVEGHLVMRNVGMVRFCGGFTVTGNIYVSSRTSFGPIPKDARVDGQIIL